MQRKDKGRFIGGQHLLQRSIESKLEPIAPSRLQGALQTALRQVRRLILIVDALLDVTRFDTGAPNLNLSNVDLVAVVKGVVEALGADATCAGSALVVFAPDSVIGRWDAARRYVLFQSFSGGAHCCNQIQVVLPGAGRAMIVDLGAWDGDYIDPPRDEDGDGTPDFVLYDNAFLYAFSSYAGSWAPPKILDIVDGVPTDVSTRPAFRALFEEDLTRARAACLDHRGAEHELGDGRGAHRVETERCGARTTEALRDERRVRRRESIGNE